MRYSKTLFSLGKERLAGPGQQLLTAGELVQHFKTGLQNAATAFSADVEELFYSVTHDGIYIAVRDSITRSGEVGFQNSTGANCDHFMVLLELYLQSTGVVFNEHFYVQKSGICIASSVAPVLCDIYLSATDKRISGALDGLNAVKIFHYVDD